MTISDNANAAADYIEEHGWTKGDFVKVDGSVCTIGALGQGSLSKVADFAAVDILVEPPKYKHPTTNAISDYLGIKSGNIARWNDEVAQSKEEVIQVLRDVAIKHQSDEMRGGD